MALDKTLYTRTLPGLLGIILHVYGLLKLRERRKRKYKTRPINRIRKTCGGFRYYQKMKSWDNEQFFKYTRMNKSSFNHLLSYIKPAIEKQYRSDGISSEERAIISLQFLSQGTSMQALDWNFHIGITTVHKIIMETREAIWTFMGPKYLKTPQNEIEWLAISNGFWEKWNFPNCLGALDGKHVNIKAPANSGSLFFNYKNNFSIVLLTSCDSNYKFTFVDIGAYGSQSDGGIFKNSNFRKQFEAKEVKITQENKLPNSDVILPFYLVADEAFPLKKYIMRPYPGKNLNEKQIIFNCRLSRARQVIENSFGILSARWRILNTTINAKVENADKIVKAVVVLHNYCQTVNQNEYCPPNYVDNCDQTNGVWRLEQAPLTSVGRTGANIARRDLYNLRDKLAYYLVSDGKVSWQNNIMSKGLLFTNS